MFDEVKNSVGILLADIGIKDKYDFTLAINNVEFPVISGRVFRSMDTCVDGCSATIVLNDKVRETLSPFGYEDAQVYLGGELVITGLVYSIEPQITSEEKILTLTIYSSACDIIDSVQYPPYEFNFVTLEDLATRLIEGLGLVVNINYEIGSAFFERVTMDSQQSIFSFLNELANQNGALITSDENGDILFIKANTTGDPVETIKNVTNVSAKYNGRELFATYRATAMTPVREKVTKKLKTKTKVSYKTVQTIKYAEAYDSVVPTSRRTIARTDNTSIEKLPDAANWQRSKRWAEALTIQIPRIGWRPIGSSDLYRENTLVTLKNADLWIGDGFDFLIKSVEYTLDSSGAVDRRWF
jgi:prophage tail gpP-like protein